MAKSYSAVWIDHGLFIRSSSSGHLRFLLLAAVTNASVNVGVRSSESSVSVLWRIYLRVDVLDPMVTVFSFWGSTDRIPRQLAILHSRQQG